MRRRVGIPAFRDIESLTVEPAHIEVISPLPFFDAGWLWSYHSPTRGSIPAYIVVPYSSGHVRPSKV